MDMFISLKKRAKALGLPLKLVPVMLDEYMAFQGDSNLINLNNSENNEELIIPIYLDINASSTFQNIQDIQFFIEKIRSFHDHEDLLVATVTGSVKPSPERALTTFNKVFGGKAKVRPYAVRIDEKTSGYDRLINAAKTEGIVAAVTENRLAEHMLRLLTMVLSPESFNSITQRRIEKKS